MLSLVLHLGNFGLQIFFIFGITLYVNISCIVLVINDFALQLLGVSLIRTPKLMLNLWLKLLRKVVMLVMISRIQVLGIIIRLLVWKQCVFSPKTLQNVSLMLLVFFKHQNSCYQIQLSKRQIFFFLSYVFVSAAVVAGKETELLIGMKNEGKLLIPYVIYKHVFGETLLLNKLSLVDEQGNRTLRLSQFMLVFIFHLIIGCWFKISLLW